MVGSAAVCWAVHVVVCLVVVAAVHQAICAVHAAACLAVCPEACQVLRWRSISWFVRQHPAVHPVVWWFNGQFIRQATDGQLAVV